MSSPPRRGGAAVTAALLAVQVFFGVHYLAAKLLLREIPPRPWVALRVAGAGALLLLATRALGRRWPASRGDLARLAGLSILGVVVNQICFVEGLARTTATHSAIINTLIPAGTLLFAVLLGRESLDVVKTASLALAFGGVLLVVRPDVASFASTTFRGDLLTLANGLSYSLFLVLAKPVLDRNDPLASTSLLLLFGLPIVAAIGAPGLASLDLASISGATWAYAAFIVVFPTAGAYFLIFWALARAESSAVAFFVYLQPIIAAVLSAAILGERLSSSTLVGAAMIFAGVGLVTRRRSDAPATRSEVVKPSDG